MPLDRPEVLVVGLLDGDHVRDLAGQVGEQVRRDVDRAPRRDVVEDDRRLAGGFGDGVGSGPEGRPGSACCSRGSRPARRGRRPSPRHAVSSTEWRVSLEPVPAITVARSPTSSRTASRRRSFSSSESVGDSPVVPATTRPCEPFSTRWRRQGAGRLEVERAVLLERRHHRRDHAREARHRPVVSRNPRRSGGKTADGRGTRTRGPGSRGGRLHTRGWVHGLPGEPVANPRRQSIAASLSLAYSRAGKASVSRRRSVAM